MPWRELGILLAKNILPAKNIRISDESVIVLLGANSWIPIIKVIYTSSFEIAIKCLMRF